MSINGYNKEHKNAVTSYLSDIETLCNLLSEIDKYISNVSELINGEENRIEFLKNHKRDTNAEKEIELEDINKKLNNLSDLAQNLDTLYEKFDEISE